MTDLAQDWKVMTPAERRRVVRARVLGTDQTIFARIAKRLGMVRRPSPPPARRVAARALVLAAVVGRASVEMNLRDTHSESSGPVSDQVLARLKRLGLTSELEPEERAFLSAPLGRVDPVLVTNAAWRGEGLAVLAWALNRLALPPYDEPAFPPDRAQKSVGFENPDVARELLTSATLRPPAEIERYATTTTVVSWRCRTFRMYPGPWDLIGYLRSQPSFKETWLEGLRVVDGDLAVGSQPIASAPAERVQACERIAVERQTAAYWLEGDGAVYSKVDPTTFLSAC
ncbi:MAG TPA: DUF4272 domain-containing protein [Gemmataceae bacterium]|nr:DUF4272 domain-containing protein [Gemmataceae bacterium]